MSASGRGAPHRAFAAAIVGLVVALMVTFVTTPARAAGSPATLAIDEAKRARLAESAEWRRLLHVHRTAGNGLEAEPDGPEFYLSPRGVFDPEAELEATIGALYAPASLGDSHALCKFPARARFLGETFELGTLPKPVCAARDGFYARLRPRRVLFVFSTYHVTSPASAFGHVLLRVERDETGILREGAPEHPLADIGIDYSADVAGEGAIAYAAKGLFGGFRGTFKAMPYALKVREYQDHDARDLWEYELTLTSDEKTRFIEHLWELGQTSFDYFYLTENCAYHVLALLDVVRPEAHLLDALSRPVLPTEAVLAVANAKGLVGRVRYRPSARTVALARLERLSGEGRSIALALGRVPAPSNAMVRLRALPASTQAEVLDAAIDWLDLEHPELLETDENVPARAARFSLLAARAALPDDSPPLDVPTPDDAPHFAHGARRVAVGTGYVGGSGAYLELRARLLLHETLDPPRGLPRLGTLEAGEVALRGYPGARSVELERLTALRVERLAPLGATGSGTSYRFGLGGERVRDHGCAGCFVAHAEALVGAAIEPWRGVVAFARPGLTLDAASPLEGLRGSAFRLGVGPTGGVRLDLTKSARLGADVRFLVLPGAPTPWTAEASFDLRVDLLRAVSLGLAVRRTVLSADVGLTSFVYF